MSTHGFPPPQVASRIWRACENCRKKKTKCNGTTPCSFCADRGLQCIYPSANDNAARSRQDTINFGMHYDRLDNVCERMEQMMTRLTAAVKSVEETPKATTPLTKGPAASASQPQSLPDREGSTGDNEHVSLIRLGYEHDSDDRSLAKKNNLIPDASNTDRYIGGASNTLSVNLTRSSKAYKAAGENDQRLPNLLTPALYGVSEPRPMSRVGLQDCNPPPRYISDVLVNLFLTRLNPMFPILDKRSFTLQYTEYLSRNVTDKEPSPFRSILYAVYACASNMLAVPRQGYEPQNGTDYFKLALFDHYQNLGHSGLEEVQCLAILSTCAASWNNLTESWKLAGQAVRAAQDLGLHIHFEGRDEDQSRSRLWWCVFTLNSCLSTCLGRPAGVIDTDYDCKVPNAAEESPVFVATGSSPSQESTTSEGVSIAGLFILAQACRILNAVNYCTQELICDVGDGEVEHRCPGENRAAMLEMQLSEWVQEKIPSSIKYAANEPEKNGGMNLAICMIAFMLHAIAVINLNLPLIEEWEVDASMFEIQEVGAGGSVCKVITAARGIIRGSELIGSNIPPSHYLAFCVHLLYTSGFVLFKAFQISRNPRAAEDIETCVVRLAQLDTVYPGAMQRSESLQRLLHSEYVH